MFLDEYDSSSDMYCLAFKILPDKIYPLHLPRFTGNCFLIWRSVHTIQFLSQLLLKFKEVSDASQHFFELKQWQKNNWI